MSAALSALLLLSNQTNASADESVENIPSASALGLYVENDARTVGGPGSDQAYSNGLRLSYVYARGVSPAWAEFLASRSETWRRERDKALVNYSVSLAHQIFTPENKVRTDLITDDRPYAAWLALAFAANLRTPSHGHFLEVSLGVVGPGAAGQAVQNEFHRVIKRPEAGGWEHQLKNEPTAQLSYQQRLKFFELGEPGNKTFDLIPYFGGMLGNVMTSAHVGGVLRFGTQIPDDLGPTRPSSSDGDSFLAPNVTAVGVPERWSLYAFAGARGVATARNIFLDGNTWADSHRVHKYPLTAETEFGLGLQRKPLSLIWRFVTRSPEFEERGRFNSFGSVSGALTF